jgi:hypothetical protein
MENVIARLSERAPAVAVAPLPGARRSGCVRLAEPARTACTTFCETLDCDRKPGPQCEPLRARYQVLTGARTPPCVVALGSGRITAPCDGSHLDLWSFPVKRGRQYTISADTIDAATAADLCLAGSCQGLEPFGGNDEVPCRSGAGFGCPRATFVAVGDGRCLVAVSVCSPRCADRESARYELAIEGADSMMLVADDTVSASEAGDDR